MGKKGRKRAKAELSPSDKSLEEPKSKMAQVDNSQQRTPNSQQINCQQQSPGQPGQYYQGTPSYILPPTFQYQHPGQSPQQAQMTTMPHNPGSPVLSQGGNINSTPIHSDHLLQTIITRMESMEKKLDRLDTISTQISDIGKRLDTIDIKIVQIEESQTFIGGQFDSIAESVKSNKDNIQTLRGQIGSLTDENTKLKNDKCTLAEDIIDLKCRSMRDNLLFFGIAEGTNPGRSGDSNHMETNQSAVSEGRAVPEDCDTKVIDFCENVLKIPNSSDKILIDRSHRLGAAARDKIRPIVVKFKDTKSKMVVKNSLKSANLKSTPFNVTEQYPPEVQERRRSLIPAMIEARKESKKAVLVRDKLYINNRLYTPAPPSVNNGH